MKIRLNENEKVVKMVKEGLKKKNGYCPCRLRMRILKDTVIVCFTTKKNKYNLS